MGSRQDALKVIAAGAAMVACLGCDMPPGPVDDVSQWVQVPATSVSSISCGNTYQNQSTSSSTARIGSYGCAPGVGFSGKEWIRRLTVANAGDVVISNANASDYSFLAVLRDDGTGVIDSDACVAANYYAVRFTAKANERFYVVVDSPATNLTFNAKVECQATTAEASCTDGHDNDADYAVDCADSDCTANAACSARCAPATVLSCNQKLVSGNTSGFGSTDQVDSYSCPSDRDPTGRERGYTFTATSTGPVVFTLSNFFQYPMIYVMEDDGSCNPNKCIAHNFYSVRWNAVAGKTYHIVTDGEGSTSYSYLASLVCDAPTSEQTCDDNIDEDGDFLIDCKDPDCSASASCGTGSCSMTGSDKLDCNTRRLAGSTATVPPAVTKMWNYACTPGLSLNGPERVYTIAPVTKDTQILVTLSRTSTYGWVGIIEEKNNACGPGACIAGNYYGVKFTAKKNRKYYAVVEGDYAPTIDYEVSAICSPPSDEDDVPNGCFDGIDNDGDARIDCADVFECFDECEASKTCSSVATISCSTTLLPDSTSASGSTSTVKSYACAPDALQPGNERAYKFVPTKNGWVNFTTSDRSSYASVAVLVDVGEGCDTNRCQQLQYYSNLVYVFKGLTYYVVVDAPEAGPVDYKLSVVCDPAPTETACNDNIDNDADFLIDGADPDCN
jgi:hypothetical protein